MNIEKTNLKPLTNDELKGYLGEVVQAWKELTNQSIDTDYKDSPPLQMDTMALASQSIGLEIQIISQMKPTRSLLIKNFVLLPQLLIQQPEPAIQPSFLWSLAVMRGHQFDLPTVVAWVLRALEYKSTLFPDLDGDQAELFENAINDFDPAVKSLAHMDKARAYHLASCALVDTVTLIAVADQCKADLSYFKKPPKGIS